jgi:hypothetical protein
MAIDFVVENRLLEYNEDQPRDEHGQWTSGSGDVAIDGKDKSEWGPHGESLNYYVVEGGAYDINSALREGRAPSLSDAGRVRALDEMMRANPKDETVYRIVGQGQLNSLEIGQTFQDHGFVSTTSSFAALEDIALDIQYEDVSETSRLTIQVPKGTPSLDVNHYLGDHQYSGQKELILGRGQKYQVTNTDGKGNVWATIIR